MIMTLDSEMRMNIPPLTKKCELIMQIMGYNIRKSLIWKQKICIRPCQWKTSQKRIQEGLEK